MPPMPAWNDDIATRPYHVFRYCAGVYTAIAAIANIDVLIRTYAKLRAGRNGVVDFVVPIDIPIAIAAPVIRVILREAARRQTYAKWL